MCFFFLSLYARWLFLCAVCFLAFRVRASEYRVFHVHIRSTNLCLCYHYTRNIFILKSSIGWKAYTLQQPPRECIVDDDFSLPRFTFFRSALRNVDVCVRVRDISELGVSCCLQA